MPSPDVLLTRLAGLIDPLASNTRAHRFYERLGFQFVDRRRFGKDDCCVYRLKRADWHQEGGRDKRDQGQESG